MIPAEMRFKLWLKSESGADQFCWMASADRVAFHGMCTSGSLAGWNGLFIDFSAVRDYGNLLGEPDVWVALVFVSDSDTHLAEGAFVDNVVVRKCTLPTCPTTSAATAQVGGEFRAAAAAMMMPAARPTASVWAR